MHKIQIVKVFNIVTFKRAYYTKQKSTSFFNDEARGLYQISGIKPEGRSLISLIAMAMMAVAAVSERYCTCTLTLITAVATLCSPVPNISGE